MALALLVRCLLALEKYLPNSLTLPPPRLPRDRLQAIFTAVLFLLVLFFMPQSYAPTILARRAKKLRKETGDESIMTEQERLRRPGGEVLREALLRPMVMLGTEAIMIAFSGYLCLSECFYVRRA